MTPDAAAEILNRVDRVLEQQHNFERRLDVQDSTLGELRSTSQRVEDQVAKTNGRVKDLELWRASLQGAMHAVGWVPPLATAVAGAVIGAVATHLF